MSLTDTTYRPPQSYEAVDAVYSLVNGSATVTAQFYQSVKYIYKNVRPAEPGFQSVTVRERQDLGGRLLPTMKYDDVPIHVVVECDARLPDGGENTQYAQWISRMHDIIAQAVVGQKPSLTLGEMHLPIRYEAQPSTPLLDVTEDRWRSVALYYVMLKEVETV